MREMVSVIALATILTPADAGGSARADDSRAYGKYLAGECITCHRIDGTDNGIPSIVGWTPERFTNALREFQSGNRDNPAMVSVATSLDDKQIAALAAYFGALAPPEKPRQ